MGFAIGRFALGGLTNHPLRRDSSVGHFVAVALKLKPFGLGPEVTMRERIATVIAEHPDFAEPWWSSRVGDPHSGTGREASPHRDSANRYPQRFGRNASA